jgi:hypothetical protein
MRAISPNYYAKVLRTFLLSSTTVGCETVGGR